MGELNVKLSPKEILNKEFKFVTNGYRPEEVDQFLDGVIEDYSEFIRFIKKLDREREDLIEENSHLKSELRKLKMEIETIEETDTGKFTTNNVDLLKRISNLEKIVYGKDE